MEKVSNFKKWILPVLMFVFFEFCYSKKVRGLLPKYGFKDFGLIYFVLFENSKINLNDPLVNKLQSTINEKREDKSYSRSPNRLGNLRERLNDSIQISKKYKE